ASTSAWRRRSSLSCETVSSVQPSRASRRQMAEPTMPRWPATQTRRPDSRKCWSIARITALALPTHGQEIGLDHVDDKIAEAGARVPAEAVIGLAGIAAQVLDLGRPEIARVDDDERLAGGGIEPALLLALAAPLDAPPDMVEGDLDELAHRMALAGGEHVVVGLVLLEHQPHALDIVARMPPVAPGIEVAEIEPFLQAERDRRDTPGDLARDEGLAAGRPLVIEEDAVGGV